MKSVTTPLFEESYKRLNPSQKKAVDTIEGPVMVIAGPGTGKTQVLTLRIANIIRTTDIAPENILALTFTESGVYSMRKRLADIIGAPAYKVHIYTFHSFCNDVIKHYPEFFPRILASHSATDIDQIKIIEEIISNNSFEKLKPFGDVFYYVRPLLSAIKDLKRENISVEQFEKVLATKEKYFSTIPDLYYDSGRYKGQMKGKYADEEKQIAKNKELAFVYSAYQAALEEKKLFDFEDMIIEVIKSLEQNQDLLLMLQETYQYVLADEHQDANNAQNKLLELLSSFHENPNIFIVGDEKQAIFRFQGASLENFLYFKKLYPEATVITLEENYRSIQRILDGSHSLILNNQTPDPELRRKLVARTQEKDATIKLFGFSRPEFEMFFVVQDIKKKIEAGIDPNEIVVLYRNNSDVDPLVKTLEKVGITFAVHSDQNILADYDIRKIILILTAIENLGDDQKLSELLYINFFGLNGLDIYKIANYSYKNKKPLFDCIRSLEDLDTAQVEEKQKFIDIYHKLTLWKDLSKNIPVTEYIETIIRESGYIQYILSLSNSAEKLGHIDALFAELNRALENHRNYTPADFLRHIEVLELYKVSIKARQLKHNKAINLMTAHRSKGLEFKFVYIIGVTDGHWGNKRNRSHFKLPIGSLEEESTSFDPLEDERRLFYVAMTRAKSEVLITYARTREDGKECMPSQFISEIDPTLIEQVAVDAAEAEFIKNAADKFAPKIGGGIDVKDREYLRGLFLDHGLAVTAINNFLKCPWSYFFRNLIRLPSTQEKSQLYGIAVHATLKDFFDKYRIEEDLSKEMFLHLFEHHLSKMPLSSIDFKESLEKGKEALAGYYDTYKGSWNRNVFTEFSIAGVSVEVDLGGGEKIVIPIRGNLDKVEIVADGKVKVVDYKTRRPMSRNDIEGKTKTSTGDYKRQLLFYRYLLDKHDDGKYEMVAGEIDFIEPTEKGQYKKEMFEIVPEEMQQLDELVKEVSRKIYNFEFWDSHCDDKACEYCALVKMFKK